MKRYLLLYNGPPAPPNPSHEGWPEWFQRTGDEYTIEVFEVPRK